MQRTQRMQRMHRVQRMQRMQQMERMQHMQRMQRMRRMQGFSKNSPWLCHGHKLSSKKSVRALEASVHSGPRVLGLT